MSDRPPSPSLQSIVPLAALAVDGLVALTAPSSYIAWYVIRASGIIAYVLLALSMVAGIMISSRSLPPGAARADAFEAHGFLSLLVLCFSSVHGLALLLDTYIGFTPAQIAIPFTSTYRPLAVGLGIIGLYLLGLIYVSFWLKRFIGYRGWHMLHFGSFAAFVLAAAHGILSGTDSPTVWMALIYSASLIGVIGMLAWKVARARSPKANTAPARLLATAR